MSQAEKHWRHSCKPQGQDILKCSQHLHQRKHFLSMMSIQWVLAHRNFQTHPKSRFLDQNHQGDSSTLQHPNNKYKWRFHSTGLEMKFD